MMEKDTRSVTACTPVLQVRTYQVIYLYFQHPDVPPPARVRITHTTAYTSQHRPREPLRRRFIGPAGGVGREGRSTRRCWARGIAHPPPPPSSCAVLRGQPRPRPRPRLPLGRTPLHQSHPPKSPPRPGRRPRRRRRRRSRRRQMRRRRSRLQIPDAPPAPCHPPATAMATWTGAWMCPSRRTARRCRAASRPQARSLQSRSAAAELARQSRSVA
mmetsp:Transcript_24349/g.77111  ORF Transcript_24349/g.77111 Transcript_24349/m.77111 type:complete len:215 (-) Transcript_24349:66-710(-)